MASLTGRDFSTGDVSLTLSPLGNEGSDTVAYAVAWAEYGKRREFVFSVADWFTGQDDIWFVARVFSEVDRLARERLAVDLWRTGKPRQAQLTATLDWLHVGLLPNEKQRKVRCLFFIRDGDNDMYHRLFIQVDIAEAVKFGEDLEREIIRLAPEWARGRSALPASDSA